MRGFPAPWGIAGGWALDLFLGRETRPHGDVDLALFREDQAALRRHLTGWAFQKVEGGRVSDWSEADRLLPPVHEVHARRVGTPPARLEFLLNEREGEQWVYRRHRDVRCPAGGLFLTSEAGLPVLCPAVVLLYKAKALRPVDQGDFEVAHGALPPSRRAWLRAALETVHPGHPWLSGL
jgi:hypothetical protein